MNKTRQFDYRQTHQIFTIFLLLFHSQYPDKISLYQSLSISRRSPDKNNMSYVQTSTQPITTYAKKKKKQIGNITNFTESTSFFRRIICVYPFSRVDMNYVFGGCMSFNFI